MRGVNKKYHVLSVSSSLAKLGRRHCVAGQVERTEGTRFARDEKPLPCEKKAVATERSF